jgi:hypothetical protein
VTITAHQTVNASGGTVATVSARPTSLKVLDTATFAATIAATGTAGGPYAATLELLPRDGGPTRSAAQGGFQLCRDQPLRLYWEWRAGTTLPPGVYTVRVILRDRSGRIVATGTAPTLLDVAPCS